jgi:hypothetical protein
LGLCFNFKDNPYQLKSQVISFRSGVNEENNAQFFGEFSGELLRVMNDVRVKVARVDIQFGHLFCSGFNDFGMRVADYNNPKKLNSIRE